MEAPKMDPLTIGLLIGGLVIGGAGGFGLSQLFDGKDRQDVTVTDEQDVQREKTDQVALATETVAVVCTPGKDFDALMCFGLDVCQASGASNTELVAPCSAIVNDILLVGRVKFCLRWADYGYSSADGCRAYFREKA